MPPRKKTASIKRPSKADQLAKLAYDTLFAPTDKASEKTGVKMISHICELLEKSADSTLEHALNIADDLGEDVYEYLGSLVADLASSASVATADDTDEWQAQLLALPILMELTHTPETGQMHKQDGAEKIIKHLRTHPFLDDPECSLIVADYILHINELVQISFSEAWHLTKAMSHLPIDPAAHTYYEQALDRLKIVWPALEASDEHTIASDIGFIIVCAIHKGEEPNPFQNPLVSDPHDDEAERTVKRTENVPAQQQATADLVNELARWHKELADIVAYSMGIDTDPDNAKTIITLDPVPFFEATEHVLLTTSSLKIRSWIAEELNVHNLKPHAVKLRLSCYADPEFTDYAVKIELESHLTGHNISQIILEQYELPSFESLTHTVISVLESEEIEDIEVVKEIRPIHSLHTEEPAHSLPYIPQDTRHIH